MFDYLIWGALSSNIGQTFCFSAKCQQSRNLDLIFDHLYDHTPLQVKYLNIVIPIPLHFFIIIFNYKH